MHGKGLSNPLAHNVERWRRTTDSVSDVLTARGIRVINASPVSALKNYLKMDIIEALDWY
jgi:hypothetical protein